MRKTYGILGVLVLALLLGLMLAAGPAAADGAAAGLHGTFLGVLDDGVLYPDQPTAGDLTTVGWTWYGQWLKATGPEGARFLGYVVSAETTIERPSGNNSHTGVVAYTSVDPSTNWNDALSFEQNLAPLASSVLWYGTVTGDTHANHNHVWIHTLQGRNGNAGLTATVRWVVNIWTNANGSAVIGY